MFSERVSADGNVLRTPRKNARRNMFHQTAYHDATCDTKYFGDCSLLRSEGKT